MEKVLTSKRPLDCGEKTKAVVAIVTFLLALLSKFIFRLPIVDSYITMPALMVWFTALLPGLIGSGFTLYYLAPEKRDDAGVADWLRTFFFVCATIPILLYIIAVILMFTIWRS